MSHPAPLVDGLGPCFGNNDAQGTNGFPSAAAVEKKSLFVGSDSVEAVCSQSTPIHQEKEQGRPDMYTQTLQWCKGQFSSLANSFGGHEGCGGGIPAQEIYFKTCPENYAAISPLPTPTAPSWPTFKQVMYSAPDPILSSQALPTFVDEPLFQDSVALKTVKNGPPFAEIELPKTWTPMRPITTAIDPFLYGGFGLPAPTVPSPCYLPPQPRGFHQPVITSGSQDESYRLPVLDYGASVTTMTRTNITETMPLAKRRQACANKTSLGWYPFSPKDYGVPVISASPPAEGHMSGSSPLLESPVTTSLSPSRSPQLPPSSRSRGPALQRRMLTPSERRRNRMLGEKQRREELNRRLAEICALVLAEEGGGGLRMRLALGTKSVVLQRVADWLERLIRDNERLKVYLRGLPAHAMYAMV